MRTARNRAHSQAAVGWAGYPAAVVVRSMFRHHVMEDDIVTSTTAALDHAAFQAIIQRVFIGRSSTLVDEARPYSVADLHGVATRTHREIQALLETLPESAFALQAAANGEPCWSAGQIVAHAVGYQINVFLRAARLAAGMEPRPDVPNYPDHAAVPALSRADALALLDIGNRDLEDILASLPPGADVEATLENEITGVAGYKDMLLLLGLHDDDHLEQLKTLARSNG
jgi:hypothetical protein